MAAQLTLTKGQDARLAGGVDDFCQKILTGSRGPFNEDGSIGSGNDGYGFKHFLHLGALADHIMEGVSVADDLIQLVLEGQVMKRGQSADDGVFFIFQGNDVGPDGNLFTSVGNDFSLPDTLLDSFFDGFF